MRFLSSLLLAVAIVVASLLLANHPNAAGRGPYQLMSHSNTTANASVFRLDTVTGEVSYCYVTVSGGPESARITCTTPTP